MSTTTTYTAARFVDAFVYDHLPLGSAEMREAVDALVLEHMREAAKIASVDDERYSWVFKSAGVKKKHFISSIARTLRAVLYPQWATVCAYRYWHMNANAADEPFKADTDTLAKRCFSRMVNSGEIVSTGYGSYTTQAVLDRNAELTHQERAKEHDANYAVAAASVEALRIKLEHLEGQLEAAADDPEIAASLRSSLARALRYI